MARDNWSVFSHTTMIGGKEVADGPATVAAGINSYGDGPERTVANFERKSDAEFACRACNSHDALMSALQGVVNQLSQGNVVASDISHAISIARAALAAAKEA